MDTKLKEAKIKMWQDKLIKLKKEYDEIMVKRGEAIAMGDLRENSAFQMLDEDAATWKIRIEEVEKIIEKLEGEK